MSAMLYRYFDSDGILLYVGISKNALVRLYQRRKAKWLNRVVKITMETFSNRSSALRAERNAIRNENPKYNVIHSRIKRFNGKDYNKSALGIYLQKNKINRTEFANIIKCSPQAIWLWATGRQRPSTASVYKIELATKGDVMMEDFLKLTMATGACSEWRAYMDKPSQ